MPEIVQLATTKGNSLSKNERISLHILDQKHSNFNVGTLMNELGFVDSIRKKITYKPIELKQSDMSLSVA